MADDESWFIFTKRFGGDVRNPSAETLRDAIDAIVNPRFPLDHEHRSVIGRYGHDDGPMYVLTYDVARCLTFEQWADADFDQALSQGVRMVDVAAANAFQLFACLQAGDLDAVKQQAWLVVP